MKNVGIKLNKTQKTILQAILENNKYTIDEPAAMSSVERRTIERNIKTLREKGILDRNGSKKDGYWIVNI